MGHMICQNNMTDFGVKKNSKLILISFDYNEFFIKKSKKLIIYIQVIISHDIYTLKDNQ